MKHVMLIGILVFMATAQAHAAQVDNTLTVPQKAASEPTAFQVNDASATVLVANAVVVTATKGAAFQSRTVGEGVEITLSPGNYALQVGKAGAMVRVNETAFHLISCDIRYLHLGGQWYVMVKDLALDGQVRVTEGHPTWMPCGQWLRINGQKAPFTTATPEETMALNQSAQSLQDIARSVSAEGTLASIDVETPMSDGGKGGQGNIDDPTSGVEFEQVEIEIEAECVEICAD